MSRVVGGKRLSKEEAEERDKKLKRKGPLGFIKNVLKIGKKQIYEGKHPAGGGGRTQASARSKLNAARNVQKQNPSKPGEYARNVSEKVQRTRSTTRSGINTARSANNMSKDRKKEKSKGPGGWKYKHDVFTKEEKKATQKRSDDFKKARKEGTLEQWERKYYPDRYKRYDQGKKAFKGQGPQYAKYSPQKAYKMKKKKEKFVQEHQQTAPGSKGMGRPKSDWPYKKKNK